jgi:hypothetical protein
VLIKVIIRSATAIIIPIKPLPSVVSIISIANQEENILIIKKYTHNIMQLGKIIGIMQLINIDTDITVNSSSDIIISYIKQLIEIYYELVM